MNRECSNQLKYTALVKQLLAVYASLNATLAEQRLKATIPKYATSTSRIYDPRAINLGCLKT